MEPLDSEIGLGALSAGGEVRLSGFVLRGSCVGGIAFVFQPHLPWLRANSVTAAPQLLDFTGHGKHWIKKLRGEPLDEKFRALD